MCVTGLGIGWYTCMCITAWIGLLKSLPEIETILFINELRNALSIEHVGLAEILHGRYYTIHGM